MKRGFDINIISKYRQEIYGIATIWVILSHVSDYEMINFDVFGRFGGTIDYIFSSGNISVDIFLFLSGVSLYFAWNKNNDIDHFYRARVERILPSYLIMMIAAGLIHIIFNVGEDPNSYLLTLSGIEIFIDGSRITPWYVPCIALCYLLFPAFYVLIYGKESKYHFIRFIFLMLLVYGYIYALYDFNEDYYDFIEIIIYRIPVFITGIYAGRFVKKGISLSGFMWPLCFALVALSVYGRMAVLYKWYYRLPFIIEAIPLTYLFAGLIYLLDIQKNIVARGIKTGLSKLGNVSFEVYVAHVMLIRLFVQTDGPFNILYLLIGLVVSIVSAFAVRHLAEKITSRGFSKKAIKEAN